MELVEHLAHAAGVFAAQRSLAETMTQVTRLAVEIVPGVDAAGLSLLGDRSRDSVATDAFAGACQALQFRLGEGPAVERDLGGDVVPVDLRNGQRWPQFTTRATRLGVRAMVACHLPGLRVASGRLNLYSRHDTVPAMHVAALYAAHAAAAISQASRVEHLTIAMVTRERIGQAMGLLMHRYTLTSDDATELLKQASQELNVKLRDLADVIVTTTFAPEEAVDLARRAAKDAGTRIDALRTRGTSTQQTNTRNHLAEAERRARLAIARAVHRLGEATASGKPHPTETRENYG